MNWSVSKRDGWNGNEASRIERQRPLAEDELRGDNPPEKDPEEAEQDVIDWYREKRS